MQLLNKVIIIINLILFTGVTLAKTDTMKLSANEGVYTSVELNRYPSFGKQLIQYYCPIHSFVCGLESPMYKKGDRSFKIKCCFMEDQKKNALRRSPKCSNISNKLLSDPKITYKKTFDKEEWSEVKCDKNQYVQSLRSIYNCSPGSPCPYLKDRIWSEKCCNIATDEGAIYKYKEEECKTYEDKKTSPGDAFSFMCPSGQLLTGIKSQRHNIKHERDRELIFTCCPGSK